VVCLGTLYRCSHDAGWAGLEALLAAAASGDEVVLAAGEFCGEQPIALPARVHLRGEPGATLMNSGAGPILLLAADGGRVSHLHLVARVEGQVMLEVVQARDVLIANCTFSGAALADAAISVLRSQQVSVHDCVVRDCAATEGVGRCGIRFWSSQGEVRRCRVDGGRYGIQAARDQASLELASELVLVGNNCRSNRLAAISYFSSRGQVEDNECSGSVEGAGIFVGRNTNLATEGSNVNVLRNRCHANKLSGVQFASSRGQVEENECWGSLGGIVVSRDPNSATEGSDVNVLRNRCHANKLTGIQFSSSRGQVENNECWGSLLGVGIMILRDQSSPTNGSEVNVLRNRCHTNKATGIEFASSHGQVEDNECWGSLVDSGISVLRDSKSPTEGSEVNVLRNRCHDNKYAGIRFSSSRGQVENNECWGNALTNAVAVFGEPPQVGQHHDSCTLPFGQLEAQHRGAHPLSPWLNQRRAGNQLDVCLADFLSSAGCPHCWDAFWQHPTASSTASQGLPVPPALPMALPANRAQAFRVQLGEGAVVSLRPFEPAGPAVSAPVATVREPAAMGPLASVFQGFNTLRLRADERKRTRHGDRFPPPRWAIGLVSADDPTLDRWLDALADSGAIPAWRLSVFDMTGRSDGSEGDEESMVYRQVVHGQSLSRRLLLGLQACALAPAGHALGSLAIVAAAMFAAVVALRWMLKVPDWPWTAGMEQLPAALGALWQALRSNLVDDFGKILAVAVGWVLCAMLAVNRLLPGRMGASVQELTTWLDEQGLIGAKWLAGVLKWATGKKTRAGRVLRFLARPRACHDQWVSHQIYGFRWFVAFRAAPQPALVVVRNVDVLNTAQRAELERLLKVCPRGQSAVLLTQMPGLSMLVGGFVDVWARALRGEGEWKGQPGFEAVVIHDPASLHVEPRPAAAAVRSEPSKAQPGQPQALQTLGTLLGWPSPAPTDGSAVDKAGQSAVWTQWANQLLVAGFRHEALLPWLVLGSTPQIHLSLASPNDRDGVSLQQMLGASWPVLTQDDISDRQIGAGQVGEVDECARRGTGLLRINRDKARKRLWVGRGGYRRLLAAALRDYSADVYQQGDADIDARLATLAAAAEVAHLQAALEHWVPLMTDPTQAGSHDSWRSQRPLLHLEAARYLAEERLAIAPSLAGVAGPAVAWQKVCKALIQAGPAQLTAEQALRAGAAVLDAAQAYREKGSALGIDAAEAQLRQVIKNPFEALAPNASGVWALLLGHVQARLLLLSGRAPASAARLLEDSLTQDWFVLPTWCKQAMRKTLLSLPAINVHRLCESASEQDFWRELTRLREHPGLVVGSVVGLAMLEMRHRLPPWGARLETTGEVPATLAALGDAVLALHNDLAAAVPDVPPLALKADPRGAAAQAATALLTRPEGLARLRKLLREGLESGERLAQAAAKVENAIEGLTLGVHGPLNQVLTMAENVDEMALLRTSE